MSSKFKLSLSSKRSKTQTIVNSAFDESVVFIAVTKIQKCLYDISKSKFDKINNAIKIINKDIDVITQDSKDKEKVSLLGTHLLVFQEINNKKYNEALEGINKKQLLLNQRTNPVSKLSLKLLKSLVLRYLEKQQESQKVLSEAISEVDLTGLKIRSKTLDYKILETTLICISIIADYFNQFESHSPQFRSIYAKAYHISHKYLTQYHKLTETLYSICKKFPNQNTNQNQHKLSSKRHSLAIDSKRSVIKHSKSGRQSLNSSLKNKHVDTSSQVSENKYNLKKSKPKRLRTLDVYIDIQQSKQQFLQKLYGIQSKQPKLKDKNLLKKPRLSTSLKTSSYSKDEPTQMKDLESISQIYLPKISSHKKKQQKLNATDILKYALSLKKLKPGYFNKISNKSQQNADSPAKKDCHTPKINEKTNINVEKSIKYESKTNNNDKSFEIKQNNKNVLTQRQQVLPPVRSEQISPTKNDEGCQLI